jgi:hypothetical protein
MPYKPAILPPSLRLDATIGEVMSYRRESARTVFRKIASGAYQSYKSGESRLILWSQSSLTASAAWRKGRNCRAARQPANGHRAGRAKPHRKKRPPPPENAESRPRPALVCGVKATNSTASLSEAGNGRNGQDAMREPKPASPQARAVDPGFLRDCESAAFVLREAEALGVRFQFGLEAEYPAELPATCVQDLERAIGRHRALILRLLLARAGLASCDLLDRQDREAERADG